MNQLRRRDFLRLSLAGSAGLLLAACGGSTAQPATSPVGGSSAASVAATGGSPAAGASAPAKPAKTGGTFIIAHDADVLLGGDVFRSTLSPTTGVTSALNGIGNLVKYKRTNMYEIDGYAADTWESNPDATQWTFHIRDGIKWHDGMPFTAQDAKWWLDLAMFGTTVGDKKRAPAVWASGLGPISGSEVLDGNKLRVNMKAPNPNFLTFLGAPIQQIAHPRHLMQPLIDKGMVDVAPSDVGWVSIGPFKMDSYQKGTKIQAKRNDLYWEKDAQGKALPYLDAIQWAIIPDPSAQDAAYVSGQLDMGSRGAAHVLNKVRRDAYVKALGDKVNFTDMTFSSTSIAFNLLRKGPLQDVRVRKAISMWIDRQAAFDTVAGGLAFYAIGMGPKNPFEVPDFMTWPGFDPKTRQQDMAMAKQLMADAGFASGFDTTLNGRDITRDTNVFVQGQLASLGIKAKIIENDNAGWIQVGYSRNYDINLGATPSQALIPEQTESLLDVASKTPTGGTATAHEDPKVADLFTQLSAASNDKQKRVDIWRQIETYMVRDQAIYTSLPGRTWVVPYRSYVQGLYPPPENQYQNIDYATVWLDK